METIVVVNPVATHYVLDMVVLAFVFSHFDCLAHRLDLGKTHLCTMVGTIGVEGSDRRDDPIFSSAANS